MSNYYIDIIDTEDSSHTTVVENALKSSIQLGYQGSDNKEDLLVVGSFLQFTMVLPIARNTDMALIDLFTGNEQRFKIELRQEADNALIWHGFLLPDSYSEPYKAGNLPIAFEATDGLGRIKGKYLDATFYESEHTVIEILAECLRLTGLDMPIYFSPSIENYHQPLYHTIYIHGKDFIEGGKKWDAYKILETFANDLIFCAFQSLNVWHLEGLNKRNLRTYTTHSYTSAGVYIETLEITRTLKAIDNLQLATPNVTVITPYKSITTTYEAAELAFSKNAQAETNNGWSVTEAVDGEIYALDWIGSFFPKAVTPDYNVAFRSNLTGVFDSNKKVALVDKPYLSYLQNVKISLSLTVVDTPQNQNNETVQSWDNPIFYDITFNDEVVFTNRGNDVSDAENLLFKFSEKTIDLDFEYTATANGILDVVFYEPFVSLTEIEFIEITELTLEALPEVTEAVYTDVISDEFTRELDKDIVFSDDAGAYGKTFRLQPLDAYTATSNIITVPILYSFTQLGLHYSAVSLAAANLIQEKITEVTHSVVPGLEVLDVVYNFSAGESMLIQTNTADLTGSFTVEQFYKVAPPVDRSTWQQWADSVYGIEKLRFTEIHSKIYRRLFTIPHVKVDFTLTKLPVLFNTMLRWDYKVQSNYFITNINSWDIDAGKVNVSMTRALYQNENTTGGTNNIPPFVDAGETIYISDVATVATLTSVATDPDGFIVSYQWQQITSVAGVVIATPINQDTDLTNLTEDFYTFQIIVTDNEGATASDTVNVIRVQDHTFLYPVASSTVDNLQDEDIRNFIYDLLFSPVLLDGVNLSFQGVYKITLDADAVDVTVYSRIQLIKNGVLLINNTSGNTDLVTGTYEVTIPYVFSVNATDVLQLNIDVEVTRDESSTSSGNAKIDFLINTINVVNGNVNITNVLPITISQNADV
jgi:hypothetical protein